MSFRLHVLTEKEFEKLAADVLNKTFASERKWSDGGGTGLVQWTGDLGPGMQVEIKSKLFTVKHAK